MWMQTRTAAGMLRLKGFSSEATVLKKLFAVKQRERKILGLGKSGNLLGKIECRWLRNSSGSQCRTL